MILIIKKSREKDFYHYDKRPPIPLDANGYEKVIIGEVIWVWHKFRQ